MTHLITAVFQAESDWHGATILPLLNSVTISSLSPHSQFSHFQTGLTINDYFWAMTENKLYSECVIMFPFLSLCVYVCGEGGQVALKACDSSYLGNMGIKQC